MAISLGNSKAPESSLMYCPVYTGFSKLDIPLFLNDSEFVDYLKSTFSISINMYTFIFCELATLSEANYTGHLN